MPFCDGRVKCDNFLPMKGGDCYAKKCFKHAPQAPSNPHVGVSNSSVLLCKLADEIATRCGDTFLYDCRELSPIEQWGKIAELLDAEGFTITKKLVA